VSVPSIFSPHGPVAARLAQLGWGLTLVSCAVVLAVAIILLLALFRSRPERGAEVARTGRGRGLAWIIIGGVAIPAVILIVSYGFILATQSAVAQPSSRVAADIEVHGHRWWWEVRYAGTTGAGTVTANEIHVPVGRPVRVRLVSDDVIHSFWVPELAGKTDVIPGQNNVMWLQADRPGVYRGMCAEYCGPQHAHMAFTVVAESPAEYAAWLANERGDAAAPSGPAAHAGQHVFLSQECAACHAVRGTNALGRVGPDLTHVAARRTIAAGTLRNTRAGLAGWVANSQAIKPGNYMPTQTLRSEDLQALVAYLESLK
jgi:cytochrome c oxidase subunit II